MMKMFSLLRSLSRSSRAVHEEEEEEEQQQHKNENDSRSCTSLTVWRKSLLMSCNGFTVIDSKGNLVYRVDNYAGAGRPHQLLLMDASGKSLLTLLPHKKLRLVDSWVVYEGEVGECCATSSTESPKKPICIVKKHINILHTNPNVLAYVCRGISDKRHAYVIEGSYAQRSCKVLDESRRVVAEIKRKEAMIGGVSFGVEVFVLVVQPGLDPGFAMALVLVLDQMFS